MKTTHSTHSTKHYRHLLTMTAVSFAAMFALMYAMVNEFSNVFVNVNQFYMAGLMAAPMVLIELIVMRAMYQDRRLSAIFAGASAMALIGFWILIRQQVAVTDRQFLRSMIPHHASAVLMCQEAPVENPAIKDLCKNIISSQQAEIDQMKRMLNESR
jgi:hypothetical protein